MVSGVGQNINSLQALRASNAFKTAPKADVKKFEEAMGLNDIEDRVSVQSLEESAKQALQTVEVTKPLGVDEKKLQEIQQIAERMGESNISKDDINYGFTYGRSILVDYSA